MVPYVIGATKEDEMIRHEPAIIRDGQAREFKKVMLPVISKELWFDDMVRVAKVNPMLLGTIMPKEKLSASERAKLNDVIVNEFIPNMGKELIEHYPSTFGFDNRENAEIFEGYANLSIGALMILDARHTDREGFYIFNEAEVSKDKFTSNEEIERESSLSK